MKPEQYQQLMTDYAKIISVVKTRASDVVVFNEWLNENTAWLTAPASSYVKFHSCFECGLIAHSVEVTKTLFKLRNTLDKSIPLESCAIVGLYHDTGKAGSRKYPMYVPQDSSWHREKLGQLYKINEGGVFLDVPTRSLANILPHVQLTDEEMQAIRYHDGQYCEENKPVAMKECSLTRLLHMADSWAAGIIEKVV